MWSGTRSSLQHRRASLPCRGRPRRASPDTARDPRGERAESAARCLVWREAGALSARGCSCCGSGASFIFGRRRHEDAAWIRTGPHARRGEHWSTCMCGRHEAHRSPPGLRPRRRAYAPGVTLALSRVRAACKCSPRRPLKGKSRPSIARSRAPSGHDRARPPRSPSCPTRGAAARTGWTRRAHD